MVVALKPCVKFHFETDLLIIQNFHLSAFTAKALTNMSAVLMTVIIV